MVLKWFLRMIARARGLLILLRGFMKGSTKPLVPLHPHLPQYLHSGLEI